MRKKFFEERKGFLKKVGCLALAVMLAGTGFVAYRSTTGTDVPELVTFVDPESAQIQEEEVPLASGTKTTRKVTTKTSTKKTKMKTKAKKTSTTKKTTTKQSNKTKSSSTQKVKTNTKVNTTITTKTKKNSKVKTIQTKVVTTVTTTTTSLKTTSTSAAVKGVSTSTNTTSQAGTYNVRTSAPKCDARVLDAFEKMGFTVVVNPSVTYSGCFDASARTITLKRLDATVYHELGHFLEFVGGSSSVKSLIANAYNTEKSKYTAYNKSYVLQNSSEYFAESFKNYCENPSALKQSRPNTYNAIVQALNTVSDSRVNTIIKVYGAVWK